MRSNKKNHSLQIDFLKNSFDNFQNIISLADTKAWITLSIQTLLISMGMGYAFFQFFTHG